MKLVCSLVILTMFTNTSFAGLIGDRWLDTVVLFDRPPGSSIEGGPATDALGPNDATSSTGFVSIDIPETLIVGFANNTAMDGPGLDLKIFETINDDSAVDLFASEIPNNIDGAWVFLGTVSGNATFDLADFDDLDFVNSLRFIGLDDGGGFAGFDLDAVEALNSGPFVPEPSTLCLMGLGLLGLVRRRRS